VVDCLKGYYSPGRHLPGDVVELRSGLKGMVVSVEYLKAKNLVGRSGTVEVVEVMTEKGEIGRMLSHHLKGVFRANLSEG